MERERSIPPEGSFLCRGSALGNPQEGRGTEREGERRQEHHKIQTQHMGRGAGSINGSKRMHLTALI